MFRSERLVRPDPQSGNADTLMLAIRRHRRAVQRLAIETSEEVDRAQRAAGMRPVIADIDERLENIEAVLRERRSADVWAKAAVALWVASAGILAWAGVFMQ